MKIRYFMTVLAMAALMAACAPKNNSTDAVTLSPVITDEMASMEASSGPSEETPSTPASNEAATATSAPIPSGKVFDVEISGFAFDQNTITIKIGDTVTWTNHDDSPHSVVADDGSFKSNSLKNDASFSQTFETAGTFSYHCGFHASMTGTVIVEP
jgi:plastocyanin